MFAMVFCMVTPWVMTPFAPHDSNETLLRTGEKGQYHLTAPRSHSCHRGKSGQELQEAGAKAEATEECCLLACSKVIL